MNGLKQQWWLLACGLLAACAATRPIEGTTDGCEVASEAASFEQPCAEDGTLVVLCDERQCGAYRCREVVERLTAGRVVLARYPRAPLPTSPGQGSTGIQPRPLPSPGLSRARSRALPGQLSRGAWRLTTCPHHPLESQAHAHARATAQPETTLGGGRGLPQEATRGTPHIPTALQGMVHRAGNRRR